MTKNEDSTNNEDMTSLADICMMNLQVFLINAMEDCSRYLQWNGFQTIIYNYSSLLNQTKVKSWL